MLRINWLNKKKINSARVNELIEDSVLTNQFTNYGPAVKLLEDKVRTILKINDDKSIIVVDNGTSAIHALVSGINIYHNKKFKFATQAFTFPASAQGPLKDAIILDIDDDIGLDINVIPSNIDGIIVTNVFGNVVNINKYVDWSNKNNKFLIFDNAATSFTSYNKQNSCNYGTGSIISFHHTKPIGFGEGGAIIVDKIYEKEIRKCINFGIDNAALNPQYHREGSNYKMSDIAAAYIIQYFENFDAIINKHQELYRLFKDELDKIDGAKLLSNMSDSLPFVSCLPVLFENEINAKEKYFLDRGIYCRKYYKPLEKLPISMKIYDHILCFPCNIDMTNDDILYIINSIKILLNMA